jgi:hypothetical protein
MYLAREQLASLFPPELERVFGSPYSEDPLSRGINTAYRALLGNTLTGTGSYVSSLYSEAPRFTGGKSRLLRKLQYLTQALVDTDDNSKINLDKILPGIDMTLEAVVKMGALDLSKLSEPGYGFGKIFLGMRPNADFYAYDETGDQKQCEEDVVALLRAGYTYLLPGAKTGMISRTSTFGRLSNINLSWQDSLNDGLNNMVLPEKWKERFTKMLNFRVAQTGKVEFTLGGMVISNNESDLDVNLEMILCPEDLGEWLMHSARAIRVMVMHGLGVDRINFPSFLDKLPKDNTNIFESVVGVVDNLLVADQHNPELTKDLITKMGMEKYINKASVRQVRRGIKAAELELYGRNPAKDRTNTSLSQDSLNPYQSYSDLAANVAKYMIVSVDEFYDLVPKPDSREVIESVLVGPLAIDCEANPDAIGMYMIEGKMVPMRVLDMNAASTLQKAIKLALYKDGFEMFEISWMEEAMRILFQKAASNTNIALSDDYMLGITSS